MFWCTDRTLWTFFSLLKLTKKKVQDEGFLPRQGSKLTSSYMCAGCLVIEIRDHRFPRQLDLKPEVHKILLQPDNQTVTCDLRNIWRQYRNLSLDDILLIEKQVWIPCSSAQRESVSKLAGVGTELWIVCLDNMLLMEEQFCLGVAITSCLECEEFSHESSKFYASHGNVWWDNMLLMEEQVWLRLVVMSGLGYVRGYFGWGMSSDWCKQICWKMCSGSCSCICVNVYILCACHIANSNWSLCATNDILLK